MNAWLLLKKLVNDKFTMVHDRHAQARVRLQSALNIMSRFKRGFSGRYLWKLDKSSRHPPHARDARAHARRTARTPHTRTLHLRLPIAAQEARRRPHDAPEAGSCRVLHRLAE